MLLGLSLPAFTALHVAISLAGIASGAIALAAMISGKLPKKTTAIFLATTVATSVTGCMFPATSFGPPQIVGVISLVVLALAIPALYGGHLRGLWRPVYIMGAVLALYLNVFVFVVQAFQKLPFLHSFAPTGSEPPFLVVQVAVLVIFAALGLLAIKRFASRPEANPRRP
jgi:hypothetical protein